LIDVVCVNLYPFESTVASGAPLAHVLENIDIGGPTLIRSAAKNYMDVTVVTSPSQYHEVAAEIEKDGHTSLPTRERPPADEFARPSCVIVKHATPCGIASADTPLAAYTAAYEGDTYSPYGGVIAFNRAVDEATADAMAKLFLELIVAPGFEAAALDVLKAKK